MVVTPSYTSTAFNKNEKIPAALTLTGTQVAKCSLYDMGYEKQTNGNLIHDISSPFAQLIEQILPKWILIKRTAAIHSKS